MFFANIADVRVIPGPGLCRTVSEASATPPTPPRISGPLQTLTFPNRAPLQMSGFVRLPRYGLLLWHPCKSLVFSSRAHRCKPKVFLCRGLQVRYKVLQGLQGVCRLQTVRAVQLWRRQ